MAKGAPKYRPGRMKQVDEDTWTKVLENVIALTGGSHADADELAMAVMGPLGLGPRKLHGPPEEHTGSTDSELLHECQWAFVRPNGQTVFCVDSDDVDDDGVPIDEHVNHIHHSGYPVRIAFRESDPRAVLMSNWNPKEDQ